MTLREFQIRRFEAADQQQIKQLYRENAAANPELYYRPLNGPQLPDDIALNFANESEAFYVAAVCGSVAGFCGLKTDPGDRTCGNIVNGVAAPKHQGLGIYKALFELRESAAVNCGIRTFLAITSGKNPGMRR